MKFLYDMLFEKLHEGVENCVDEILRAKMNKAAKDLVLTSYSFE